MFEDATAHQIVQKISTCSCFSLELTHAQSDDAWLKVSLLACVIYLKKPNSWHFSSSVMCHNLGEHMLCEMQLREAGPLYNLANCIGATWHVPKKR